MRPRTRVLGGMLAIVVPAGAAVAAVRPAAAVRVGAGTAAVAPGVAANPADIRLAQAIARGDVAPTVHVVTSTPPTLITQFPLVPSGLKAKFPDAKGLVTVVQGSVFTDASEIVTIDVEKMPPHATFTVFLVEQADKPFGNVEYVGDLRTREDGTGEAVLKVIAFAAFAMDARNPGTSKGSDGQETSGVNLDHIGMWFSELDQAKQVLGDDTLAGTIFDGGNPPLHAGPQAMSDGQTAAVL